jgi:hypothetical protein
MKENPELNEELLDVGRCLEALPHPQPPAGLVARTLACIDKVTKVWWLRPITHPFARLVAALLLISTLACLSDIDRAERVGHFMGRLMGDRTAEKIEIFVDRVLLTFGPVSDVEEEVVKKPERPRAQPGDEDFHTDWV